MAILAQFQAHYDASDRAQFIASYADTATIVLADDYERSSVDLANSSVTGTGDSAVISIAPKVQESEVTSSQTRWLEPSVKVTGVDGLRPTFKFLNYAATATVGTYHGAPWQTTRRPMFSYDRETWHYFDTQTVGTSDIEFRHNAAFTADTVYISRNRQISVTQAGNRLATLAGLHSFIEPTITAAAFTPTLTSWPAQTFIADEYSTQTDSLGDTVPATPLYAFQINDTGLTPSGGGPKRLAVFTCGVHAGEDHSDWAFWDAVEFLCGSSSEAQNLRREYKILCYPLLNAPGRYGGGWRGSWTNNASGHDDANRHFSDATPDLEIVTKPRTAILADLDSGTPDWLIDWHASFSTQWGYFRLASQSDTIEGTFATTLATQSGNTVTNMGNLSTGSVQQWGSATLGATLSITVEMGAVSPTSDADLESWAQAIVETLELMRADGEFYTLLSDIALAVASALHGHTVDAATLTQDNAITPAGAEHVHTADQPVLLQAHALVVLSSTHAHTVDGATLTLAGALEVDAALHGHMVDAPVLSQAGTLAPDGAAHAHAADQPTLTQANSIAPADAAHGHTAGQPVLDLSIAVVPVTALHAHGAESPILTQAQQLAVEDALHAHFADSPLLPQSYTIIASDALHAHLAASPGLTLGTLPIMSGRVYLTRASVKVYKTTKTLRT